jgi:hypothetical protein
VSESCLRPALGVALFRARGLQFGLALGAERIRTRRIPAGTSGASPSAQRRELLLLEPIPGGSSARACSWLAAAAAASASAMTRVQARHQIPSWPHASEVKTGRPRDGVSPPPPRREDELIAGRVLPMRFPRSDLWLDASQLRPLFTEQKAGHSVIGTAKRHATQRRSWIIVRRRRVHPALRRARRAVLGRPWGSLGGLFLRPSSNHVNP